MIPLEPLPTALQGWQNFYMLAGAASATLTGLMFVAVTFGSNLVTPDTPQRSTRAFLDPTYLHFVQVLLTACLMTVPTLGAVSLGCVLIAVGAYRLVGLHWVFGRYRDAQREHGDIDVSDWVMSIALPLLCHGALMAIGTGFIQHNPAAPTALAVVTMMLLFLGIHCTWELLVWMAMTVGKRRAGPPGETRPRDEG
jgi:hypothetical protein